MSNRKTTRSAHGVGTIRQRSNGSWEARYTIGRDAGTGKQIQKSVYGKTQAEVRKKLSQITAALDEGVYTEPTKLTVSAWLDIWVKDFLGSVKDTTVRSYKDNIRLHIKPAIGAISIQSLNAHTIQGFYNGLATGKEANGKSQNSKKGLSAKSIKNIHGILHRALKQAVLLGYIKSNPSEACTLPKVIKKEMKILTEDEIPTFLNALKDHKNGDMFLIYLLTGMRRGELLGLAWKNVDFENETILIQKQMQRERVAGGKLRLVTLKNGKQRRIAPATTVFKTLKKHRAKQNEKRLLTGAMWNDNGLVFCNDVGNPLDADAVYQSFKRMLAKNNLSNIRLHDLRHTTATLMIQNGDSIKNVQETLGHHTAAFTLDVYGHVTEKMQKESAERMEGFLKGISNL